MKTRRIRQRRKRVWHPLTKAAFPLEELDRVARELVEADDIPEITTIEDAKEAVSSSTEGEVWVNDRYQVIVRRFDIGSTLPTCVHLSIKRLDKAPARDWRDFQRIKNQLLGEECEAVELYPREDRVVDTSNQYHLWGFDSTEFRFPFGFDEGKKLAKAIAGARQRGFEEGNDE